MALNSPRKNTQQKTPDQYSRLERLLSFNPFNRSEKPSPTDDRDNDFIDIVLDADFSRSGKVKNIR